MERVEQETHLKPDSPVIEDQAVQALMEALPDQLSVSGLRTLRRVLQTALPALKLTMTPTGQVNGLEDEAWQSLWTQLIQAGSSYGSRRRYKVVLLKVAELWQAAGLIERQPAFTVPPQHRRRLTVAVDRLGGYRFSDYQHLVKFVVDSLSGHRESLVPSGLSEQLSEWLMLVLICCGVCQTRAVRLLTELIWEDVPFDQALPICLPRAERRGHVWLGLPPLARLLLLTTAFRAGKFSPQDKVLTLDHRTLGANLRSRLADLCQLAGLPVIAPSQLTHFVRLDLRQALPNLHLAVLLGQVPFTPVPTDQLLEVLSPETSPVEKLNPGSSRQTVSRFSPRNEDETQPAIEIDEDELLAAYDDLLDEWRPRINTLFQSHRSKSEQARIEEWALTVPNPKEDLPSFNLMWLVRWLLNMVDEKRLKPASRAVYWTAALRVLRVIPDHALHEINQIGLQEALSTYPAKTAKLTRVAWKRLWHFLQEAGLPVTPIQWRQLRVRQPVKPARVLTPFRQTELLSALHGTELAQACYLALRATLRVSEICRLRVGDLVLDGQPYLIVRRSKRGRSRRVSLAHLPAPHLEKLRLHQAKRRAAGDDAFYLVDKKGQPLQPKAISEAMSKVMGDAGLRGEQLTGQDLRFHSWRAAAAEELYRHSGDVRFVSLQMGHVLPATTVGSYLHTLDLQSIPLLKAWPTPLYDTTLHMPVLVLAALLGRTNRRIVQMVKEYNAAGSKEDPSALIHLKGPNPLPDGIRPSHRGRPADYLSVADALRLVSWFLRKKNAECLKS